MKVLFSESFRSSLRYSFLAQSVCGSACPLIHPSIQSALRDQHHLRQAHFTDLKILIRELARVRQSVCAATFLTLAAMKDFSADSRVREIEKTRLLDDTSQSDRRRRRRAAHNFENEYSTIHFLARINDPSYRISLSAAFFASLTRTSALVPSTSRR